MAIGEGQTLNPDVRLVSDLTDPDYRRAFVEGHATDTVAFQLRAMRKARDWEQRDVAEKLGNRKLQPMISRYENPDYGKYSISTLLELAAVFDVALAVRFVTFSELVEWDLLTSPSKICPVSFAEDEGLKAIANRGAEQIGVLEIGDNRWPDQSAPDCAASAPQGGYHNLGSIFSYAASAGAAA